MNKGSGLRGVPPFFQNRIKKGHNTIVVLTGDLIKLTDNDGNSINYTYDARGYRIKEEIKDTSGTFTCVTDANGNTNPPNRKLRILDMNIQNLLSIDRWDRLSSVTLSLRPGVGNAGADPLLNQLRKTLW